MIQILSITLPWLFARLSSRAFDDCCIHILWPDAATNPQIASAHLWHHPLHCLLRFWSSDEIHLIFCAGPSYTKLIHRLTFCSIPWALLLSSKVIRFDPEATFLNIAIISRRVHHPSMPLTESARRRRIHMVSCQPTCCTFQISDLIYWLKKLIDSSLTHCLELNVSIWLLVSLSNFNYEVIRYVFKCRASAVLRPHQLPIIILWSLICVFRDWWKLDSLYGLKISYVFIYLSTWRSTTPTPPSVSIEWWSRRLIIL